MIVRAVEITLDGPVIASFDVATAAVPRSLPYLPGAMLWGVLANHAYRSGQASEDILTNLYGGGLIVGESLPACAEAVALPAPKSLHQHKDSGVWKDWSKDWSNGGHHAEYEQVKDRQVGPCKSLDNDELNVVEVQMTTSQRTAIDPVNLRAADGQFYGLQAIAAGQSFIARIEGPADQVTAAIEVLAGTQASGKQHLLGRSRNVEFGRVTIKEVEPPRLPGGGSTEASLAEPGTGDATILWCLSDLAAYDTHYLPTERPDKLFGQTINWSNSFVRHRSYAPFNRKWRTRQSERLVIARGSVIVLEGGIAPGLCRAGFWQEQGLGLILASADSPLELLHAWEGVTVSPEAGNSDPPETDLSIWLQARATAAKLRADMNKVAETAWADWKPHYEAAENLAGERCGPTPTQWAALAEAEELEKALMGLQNSQGAKEQLSWQARFATGETGTFVGKALELLQTQGEDALHRTAKAQERKADETDPEGEDALRRTAKALRDALSREGWFDGR